MPRPRLPRHPAAPPSLTQGWLELLVVILGFAFSMVMVIYGYRTASRLFYAISPVIPISQGAVYLVIPISGAYMAVHLAWRFVWINACAAFAAAFRRAVDCKMLDGGRNAFGLNPLDLLHS